MNVSINIPSNTMPSLLNDEVRIENGEATVSLVIDGQYIFLHGVTEPWISRMVDLLTCVHLQLLGHDELMDQDQRYTLAKDA